MRATIDSNGVKRINAKIEIPMTSSDVTDYVLCAVVCDSLTIDDVVDLNKRELLRVAKEEIYCHGVEFPRIKASEADNETHAVIKHHIRKMFPELV
jgi:hypothetical protein